MKAVVFTKGPQSRARVIADNFDEGVDPSVASRQLLQWLVDQGVRQAAIAGLSGDDWEHDDLELHRFEQGEPLASATALVGLREWIGDRPFLVLDDTSLFGFDLADLMEAHRISPAIATIGLWPACAHDGGGSIEMDRSGRILRLRPTREGPTLPWVDTRCYIIEPKLLDAVPAGSPCSLLVDLFPLVVRQQGILGGHPVLALSPAEPRARAGSRP